ncbi:hypothetical protein BIV23_03240 [Streptomyces monashensis]|uniref:Uncharacterized protein n=1 Tax=Streptomyces monashensis TaxID=1678012 RepID=A0A1S2QN51_9ACTN|nr:hypothetical protein BIV23_03240 [Streptomyces monashensis]
MVVGQDDDHGVGQQPVCADARRQFGGGTEEGDDRQVQPTGGELAQPAADARSTTETSASGWR